MTGHGPLSLSLSRSFVRSLAANAFLSSITCGAWAKYVTLATKPEGPRRASLLPPPSMSARPPSAPVSETERERARARPPSRQGQAPQPARANVNHEEAESSSERGPPRIPARRLRGLSRPLTPSGPSRSLPSPGPPLSREWKGTLPGDGGVNPTAAEERVGPRGEGLFLRRARERDPPLPFDRVDRFPSSLHRTGFSPRDSPPPLDFLSPSESQSRHRHLLLESSLTSPAGPPAPPSPRPRAPPSPLPASP